ncbi:uncharacterized protein SAPINGB_P005539 [Magnusiomyces paraingens]|uniref:Peroxisomal membrane protein PEX16 n=1 Tax=Magnusiomyces paraingens TaxID=2606893 RepID=A0A5E8C2A6_9ASCO|nr:uncharacterized protein SAPINGB_P005539 [Saprochaete ingens]VVT57110.1 unnamed protein product [Saprochaete ingens]
MGSSTVQPPPQAQTQTQTQAHDQQQQDPQLPVPESRHQKWAHAYETFLLSNASKLANMESTIRSLSYLATGQMQNVEIVTETLYSMLQILGLYHDRIINNALQKLARKKSGALLGDPQALRPSMHNRYTQWAMNKSSVYKVLAVALTLLRNTELLWEMVGKHGFAVTILGTRISVGKTSGTDEAARDKNRWRTVLWIEAIKAALRLGLLAASHGRTVLSSPIPGRDVDTARIVRDRRGNFKVLDEDEVAEYQQREQQREMRRLAMDAEELAADDARELEEEEQKEEEERRRRNKGKGAWWRMPRVGLGLPDNPAAEDVDEFLERKVLSAEDVRGPEGLVRRLSPVGVAAEVIHLMRPLVYAFLVYQFSLQRRRRQQQQGQGQGVVKRVYGSWTPWVVGILMEYGARRLALKELRDQGLTKLESEEFKQRAGDYGWWLLRGGMYENWTR